MTTQEKIAFIREKCIEANPSIKDLVFGCEVQFEDKIYRIARESSKGNFEAWYETHTYITLSIDDTDKEILGREIRLSDVLLAIIEEKYKGIVPDIKIIWETVGNWNLLKDSLTDQSEETVDFIYNLLQ